MTELEGARGCKSRFTNRLFHSFPCPRLGRTSQDTFRTSPCLPVRTSVVLVWEVYHSWDWYVFLVPKSWFVHFKLDHLGFLLCLCQPTPLKSQRWIRISDSDVFRGVRNGFLAIRSNLHTECWLPSRSTIRHTRVETTLLTYFYKSIKQKRSTDSFPRLSFGYRVRDK